ncbi:MAG: DUF445 family protein [Balneolaceae bacterium]|nr:DUF445 family protein [Balneolaceae bacterium]
MNDLQKPVNNDTGKDENHFSRLGTILASYLEFDKDDKEKSSVLKPAQKPKAPAILRYLKPVPWLLVGLFLFSFYWDFPGYTTTLFGFPLLFEGLLRIISVSGMIGFLTNWIAITMLFRPLNKRPLLGQGLVPAHKERIAYRLATAVSDDLINPELIKKKIGESKAISRYRKMAIRHVERVTAKQEFREDLKLWLLDYIKSMIENPEFRKKVSSHLLNELDDALQDKILERAALKTYTYFRGQSLQEFIEELLEKVPVSAEKNIGFVEEYLDELPNSIHANSEKIDELITTALFKLINQLNVQHLVEENLRKYDQQKLESMIRNATNEQLKTIQYLGAVLGTIGGFVIWEPILSLFVLGVLFGSVYLLDQWLYQ